MELCKYLENMFHCKLEFQNRLSSHKNYAIHFSKKNISVLYMFNILLFNKMTENKIETKNSTTTGQPPIVPNQTLLF